MYRFKRIVYFVIKAPNLLPQLFLYPFVMSCQVTPSRVVINSKIQHDHYINLQYLKNLVFPPYNYDIITEVPTLDHEKREDIWEGRKNCGRQCRCRSHADSPRAPPPGNVKKNVMYFTAI